MPEFRLHCCKEQFDADSHAECEDVENTNRISLSLTLQ